MGQNKQTSIRIMGVPEGEERKGAQRIFEEIIAENMSNLGKYTDINSISLTNSKWDKPKRLTPRHIIIKVLKAKGRES